MPRFHFAVLAMLAAASPLCAETITLTEGVGGYAGTADTSIFAESDNAAGGGAHLYAGNTQMGNARRALIRFDLSGIPSDATVESVTLTLRLNLAPSSAAQPFRLHALAGPWGEGTANPPGPGGQGTTPGSGDATWSANSNGTSTWTSPGGDFVPAASGIGNSGAVGTDLVLAGDGLRDNVAAWLADPSTNYGWILLGNEAANGSARRFASAEGTEGQRPRLTLVLAGPLGPPDAWLLH